MAGRTPAFIDESIKIRVLDAISKGATYDLAAAAGGICFKTFRKWVLKAEAGDPEYVPFLQQLKEAEGKSVVKWLEKIDNAMDDSWQAAAWKLERRYPKSYSANAAILEMAEDIKDLKERHKHADTNSSEKKEDTKI